MAEGFRFVCLAFRFGWAGSLSLGAWFGCVQHERSCSRGGGCVIRGCQHRKNVYLSPYVEKPFNSQVIKSFVPELRSRKCFSCFEIPMFYVYIL